MPGRARQILQTAVALARPGELGVKTGRCPFCGPTLLVKLANHAISVRCIRCRASVIHMSIAKVLQGLYADLAPLTVYEMSSRGPLFDYLGHAAGKRVYSEFFDDVPAGDYRGPVQCQDVQRLTYPDASFDLCTSTEVFEHVPDDRQGFTEVYRVLKPGGRFVFTVPLTETCATVERAVLVNGALQHLLEPEYHGDAIRGQGRVLAFRNYGLDIVARLTQAGFSAAQLVAADAGVWWGLGQKVVVADK